MYADRVSSQKLSGYGIKYAFTTWAPGISEETNSPEVLTFLPAGSLPIVD
jgi:hypothetical protein